MRQLIKLSIVSTLFLYSFTICKAQAITAPHEVRQYMSKGEQPGIEVILNGTNQEDTRDAVEKWGKKMKAKVTMDKKNPEIFIENAVNPLISATPVNMYAIVTPIENGSKVTVFTDLGGSFISFASFGTQYAGMEASLKKFEKEQAVIVIEGQQKNEEKTLKTITGDLKDLTKNREDYLKDIEKAKALIKLREQDITKNEADQQAKQKQILLQQQIIQTVKTKRTALDY